MANRPVVVGGAYQSKTSQVIKRLYDQRFSFDLNLGEMVIITGVAEPKDSVGWHFFHSADFTGAKPKTAEEARKYLADMGIKPQTRRQKPRGCWRSWGFEPKSPEDAQKLLEQPAAETGSMQAGIQRLLIVRLADLSTAKPLFSEQ